MCLISSWIRYRSLIKYPTDKVKLLIPNDIEFNSISAYHSGMPCPLAPDPIRIQSYVCCLFWTNRNSMVVTSILLSILLSNQSYESFNRRSAKWKYLLLLKLWWYTPIIRMQCKNSNVNFFLIFHEQSLTENKITLYNSKARSEGAHMCINLKTRHEILVIILQFSE